MQTQRLFVMFQRIFNMEELKRLILSFSNYLTWCLKGFSLFDVSSLTVLSFMSVSQATGFTNHKGFGDVSSPLPFSDLSLFLTFSPKSNKPSTAVFSALYF